MIGAGFSGSVGSGPVPVPGSGAALGLVVRVFSAYGSSGFGVSTVATYTGFFHWA